MESLHGAYTEIDRRVAINSNRVLSAFKNARIAPHVSFLS
jgi:cystathionine beta-lyase family protein involved in aluminum resistance